MTLPKYWTTAVGVLLAIWNLPLALAGDILSAMLVGALVATSFYDWLLVHYRDMLAQSNAREKDYAAQLMEYYLREEDKK